LAGGVALGSCVIALDPFAPDDVAARRNWVLLVLGGKYMCIQFGPTRFEKVERCAFGIQRIAKPL
jgi:hypothetical protein